jgi:hypothetical protein
MGRGRSYCGPGCLKFIIQPATFDPASPLGFSPVWRPQ